MTEDIAPPADRPVTKTRFGSMLWSDPILSTICLIDSACPWSRWLSLARRSGQLLTRTLRIAAEKAIRLPLRPLIVIRDLDHQRAHNFFVPGGRR